jgi:phosphoribosyl 1,2-cyclic phosphodiesterase
MRACVRAQWRRLVRVERLSACRAPLGINVSICFESLRSSSAGNCLALWTPTSSIFIDVGLRVQRECVELVDRHQRRAGSLDGVFVSHAHGDHMAYGALRVLGRKGIPVYAHPRVIAQLCQTHDPESWKEPPALYGITEGSVHAGDFRVTPFQVPHAPGVPTFGFIVVATHRGASHTIVVCTDLSDYGPILPRLLDAEIVFVEANHDLELLRRYPNVNSRYHLNNVQTASLLHAVVKRSTGAPPKAVMLGHLSEERNRRALAVGEVRNMFHQQGTRIPFQLDAAPAHRPSDVVEL